MAHITVVGLGPAGPDLITAAAATLLRDHAHVRLRTGRHPSAHVAGDVRTFDDIYENSAGIEDVYPAIVERLIADATANDHVVYAVPGSPLVAEATVVMLRADPRVEVDIVPGLSFLDLVWARLGVDPLAVGPRLVDGHRFALEAAGEKGPLLVAQCDAPWVLSDIKLAYEDDPPESVTVMKRLGLPDEQLLTVAWAELDRVTEPDHLTTLWIPHVGVPVAYELNRVEEVARRLRQDCPWDQEQTHSSLGRYLLEESYELLEAIDAAGESDSAEAEEHLIEELGDVLFQVFAHAAIAAEAGRFNIADVAKTVSDKLIERHPHVYGDVVAETADDVVTTWESNKMSAKGRTSLMEGIPKQLPALLYALKILKKASGVGVELREGDFQNETAISRALLFIADEARRSDIDPEETLRQVANNFRLRFEEAERRAANGESPGGIAASWASLGGL